jgi:Ca2+-binding EF-hand superfamily protein
MVVDWTTIRDKLPIEKTDTAKEKRSELYNEFDPNGNGYLSLAEVDKGCRDVLGIYEIFSAKKVIMRAFQAAKSVSKIPSQHGPDFIERSEFRLLLVYLRQYFELWELMSDISGSDHRISENEFNDAITKIESWGLQIDNPTTEFNNVDTNGGGYILFEEFADWALTKKLHLETDDE